jgi:hypothetical protein
MMCPLVTAIKVSHYDNPTVSADIASPRTGEMSFPRTFTKLFERSSNILWMLRNIPECLLNVWKKSKTGFVHTRTFIKISVTIWIKLVSHCDIYMDSAVFSITGPHQCLVLRLPSFKMLIKLTIQTKKERSLNTAWIRMRKMLFYNFGLLCFVK